MLLIRYWLLGYWGEAVLVGGTVDTRRDATTEGWVGGKGSGWWGIVARRGLGGCRGEGGVA